MKKLLLLTAGWLLLSVYSIAQTTAFPANKTYSFGLMPANRNGQDAANAYNIWKTNFLSSCANGRYRVKFDDPAYTVSEGIGYGMLLSAYAGERSVFDGLWLYYKDLRNSHGVMHWKISGCNSVAGQNGATDAEVDVAMALIVAHHQWGSSGAVNYQSDAKTLIAAIKNWEVESGSNVLKPGDMFGGSNLTNPSYFAPGYFRAFGQFTSDASYWNSVADKCLQVINSNLSRNGAAGGLVSDWCKGDGSYSGDAAGYYDGGRRYHYDAARTPWRIAVDYVWFGTAGAKDYVKKSSEFVRVNLGGPRNIKDGYYQNGTAYGQWHNSTFAGPFACAAMGGDNPTHLSASYSDLLAINDNNSYFNQSLKTLTLFLLSGNFYLPGTNGGGTTNTAPVVSISSPANNASYTAGTSIVINATATDSDGSIGKVEFFQGAVKLGEDLSAPYSFTWSNVASGTYTLTARATDNAGAVATSAPVTVTVRSGTTNQAPAVSITSPANNTNYTAGSSVAINVSATDSDGSISKVEFFQGAVKLGEDFSAPYSFTWSNVAAGSYTLTAKATDNAGAVTTSSSVTITVSSTSTGNKLPVVSITSPANNATFAAGTTITINAQASDSDGSISIVRFYRGTTLLGEDRKAPYSYKWSGVPSGSYNLTATAVDNTGATASSAVVAIRVGTTGSNTAPTVAITSPANNSTFAPGSAIAISANATDSDGSVAKVEFFQGSAKLGEDLSAPYSFTWSYVASGSYTLTARAIDNAGLATTSAGVTVIVNSSTAGTCATQAIPNAANWVVRNDWADQNNGSAVSSTTEAMKVTHRQWGENYLYVVENVKSFAAIAGSEYTISFSYKDDASVSLSSMQVGLAEGVNWDGPVLIQPLISVNSGWSSSSYTTKTAKVTASRSGDVRLVIKLNWSGQVGSQVNTYIKDISICGSALATKSGSFAEETSIENFPNPFTDQIKVRFTAAENLSMKLTITDITGKQVYESMNFSTNEDIRLGSELPAGIYLLQAKFGEEVKVIRIVKH